MSAYVDAIWTLQQEENRRGRNEIVYQYGNAHVYAVSKLQKAKSLDSTGAEFTALAEGCTAVVGLRRALEELRIDQQPTLIAQDNTGPIL